MSSYSLLQSAMIENAIASNILKVCLELTEEAITKLDLEPVVIPRDNIIRRIVTSSMPVIPISGDWGQGKSFLGKLLYRYSALTKTFYVTYVPLAMVYNYIKSKGLRLLEQQFYGSSLSDVLRGEAIPAEARNMLAIILPILFSPSSIINIYEITRLLTTYPRELDLKPSDYKGSLMDIARALSTIDKRLFVVVDELEELPDLLTSEKLGALLWIARNIYDISNNIPKLTYVLLIQETARAVYSGFIDNLRVHQRYLRVYGVIHPLIELNVVSNEETKRYMQELFNRILDGYASRLFNEKLLNDALRVLEGISNTRLKISMAKNIVSNLIAKMLVHIGDSDTISRLIAKNDPQELIREIITLLNNSEKKLITLREVLENEFSLIMPKILLDILSGKSGGLAEYSDKIAEYTARVIYSKFKNRGAYEPTIRSSAKGYKVYEVLFKTQEKGTAKVFRLLVWVRLSRIDKLLKREDILKRIRLSDGEVKNVRTKLLFIHSTAVKGALIHEVDPDLIVPVMIDNTSLAAILIKLDLLKVVLNDDIIKSFTRICEENYERRIENIVELLLSRG